MRATRAKVSRNHFSVVAFLPVVLLCGLATAAVSTALVTAQEEEEEELGLKQRVCNGLGCPGVEMDCTTLTVEGQGGVPQILEDIGVPIHVDEGVTLNFTCREGEAEGGGGQY